MVADLKRIVVFDRSAAFLPLLSSFKKEKKEAAVSFALTA